MQCNTSKVYNSQRGSAYFFVMFAIVVMSISITAAAKQWKTVVQREKEADLLARGIEIQNAIGLYSKTKAAIGSQIAVYPLTLEELTKQPTQFLRKVYKDPITSEDWEYVRHTDGHIKGVRSRAKIAPIKQHQFPPEVIHFDGLTRYYDWVFQYPLTSTPKSPLDKPPEGVAGPQSNTGGLTNPPPAATTPEGQVPK
jgi:type II secretory pathway pseudopilin PulG